MRGFAGSFLAMLASLIMTAELYGQAAKSRILNCRFVYYEREHEQPLPVDRAHVLVTEHMKRSVMTDDSGFVQIELPGTVMSDQEVTLELIQEERYAIQFPPARRLRIPANEQTVVEVRVLRKGDPRLMSKEQFEAYCQRLILDSSKVSDGRKGRTGIDLSAALRELAKEKGFTDEEAARRFIEWTKEARKDKDARIRGLGEFGAKHFPEARRAFLLEVEEHRRNDIENLGEMARAFELAGDSAFSALDFKSAVGDYQDALHTLNQRQQKIEKVPPDARTPAPTDLHSIEHKIANAKHDLGVSADGPDKGRYLAEAIAGYQSLLTEQSWIATRENRALTQSNLGTALLVLGDSFEDVERIKVLRRAVSAFTQALRDTDRETFSKSWALAQHNLGYALDELGGLIKGEEGVRLHRGAVGANHLSLEVYTRATDREDWASAKNNLGCALSNLGERLEGDEGERLERQGISVFQEALEVRTRVSFPNDWATTEYNLAHSFSSLGERIGGDEGLGLLRQSISAFRQSLQIRNRTSTPKLWAQTQYNLGTSLLTLSKLAGTAEKANCLQESVSALRSALEVYTRDVYPKHMADTKHNLGSALSEQGEGTGGEQGLDLMRQAVSAYHDALGIRSLAGSPKDWAETQYNLGISLQKLSERSGDAEAVGLLEQSISAYRQNLRVCTRAASPTEWAETQNNLGIALSILGNRESGDNGLAHLREAVQLLRQALEVRTRAASAENWATTQHNLGLSLLKLNRHERVDDQESVRLLRESIDALHHALEIRTRAASPDDWANSQAVLASALFRLWSNLEDDRYLSEAVDAYRQALTIYTPACNPVERNSIQAELRIASSLLFVLGKYKQYIALIEPLSTYFKSEPNVLAALQLVEILCNVALGEKAKARTTIDKLVDLLNQQSREFHPAWEWSRLRSFIEQTEVNSLSSHRQILMEILASVAQGERDEVIVGLKKLRDKLGR